MNSIYESVSNSIIEYIKSQGQPATKPCLILRIHYYNILGVLHSIDILKTLQAGDKVVSTSTTHQRQATATPTQTKKKSKKSTDTTEITTTRHTKLGLMTQAQ